MRSTEISGVLPQSHQTIDNIFAELTNSSCQLVHKSGIADSETSRTTEMGLIFSGCIVVGIRKQI